LECQKARIDLQKSLGTIESGFSRGLQDPRIIRAAGVAGRGGNAAASKVSVLSQMGVDGQHPTKLIKFCWMVSSATVRELTWGMPSASRAAWRTG
jgi:hypothetical protein